MEGEGRGRGGGGGAGVRAGGGGVHPTHSLGALCCTPPYHLHAFPQDTQERGGGMEERGEEGTVLAMY